MTDYRPTIVLDKPSDILNYSYSSLSDEQRILYLQEQLIFNQNAQEVRNQVLLDRDAENLIREEIRIQKNADSREFQRLTAALSEATWGTPLYKSLREEQIALGEKIRLRNEMLADARDLESLQNIANIQSGYVSPSRQITIDLQAQANNSLENTIEYKQTVLEMSQNTQPHTEPTYVWPNIPAYVAPNIPTETPIEPIDNNYEAIDSEQLDYTTYDAEILPEQEQIQIKKNNNAVYAGIGIFALAGLLVFKKKPKPKK